MAAMATVIVGAMATVIVGAISSFQTQQYHVLNRYDSGFNGFGGGATTTGE